MLKSRLIPEINNDDNNNTSMTCHQYSKSDNHKTFPLSPYKPTPDEIKSVEKLTWSVDQNKVSEGESVEK